MIHDVTPLLSVADVPEACDFVERCLGFATGASFPGFAWCHRDNGAIRFVEAPTGMDLDDPARQVMIYIDVDDVDVLWADHADAIRALPDRDRQPPSDTDHGQREFVLVHRHIAFVAGQPIRKPGN